ncbi:Fanconi anemia group F protein [Hyla sarda]|uniref:Fanconi anemia group F protein n=1 Tax=Hyla sarda TaxID=327740 RepID=UPI0024C361FF|nr:Fanconi anemia group F protein [Hyla sarda]
MAEKMKTLLQNLDHFIEVLALSQSVHTKDWDILHVQGALEWGTYFQHVHHRFKTNNDLRNVIEARLIAKHQELSCYLKTCHHVTFDDLSKGCNILCMSLLQNKALPDPVFKYLTEQLRNSDPKVARSTCVSHIISQKVTSELLLSLPLLTSKVMDPLDNPVLMAEAELVKSRLEGRLRVSEDGQRLATVSDFLGRVPKPHIYHLIEVILLSNGDIDSEDQNLISDVLLDWLLSDNDFFVGFFLTVTCQVLARLSFTSPKFRNVYVDHLVQLGSSMEQDLTCGKWISDKYNLSFDGLLNHYRHLMKGPKDVKHSIVTKLQTLRSKDGNFDVPGISVWTDILAEIHKK